MIAQFLEVSAPDGRRINEMSCARLNILEERVFIEAEFGFLRIEHLEQDHLMAARAKLGQPLFERVQWHQKI